MKISYWLAKDYNLILKTEQGEGDNKLIIEAEELKLEKLSDQLFEIPEGYRRVQTVISTDAELQNDPPVNLENIDKLIFEDIESISLSMDRRSSRNLSDDEINTFRNAIRNGTGLQEVNNQEVSSVSLNHSNPVFDLHWIGVRSCNIWYDKASGFLYIAKIDVYRKDEEKHKFDFKWIKKYLQGDYKFKPSDEILKILK